MTKTSTKAKLQPVNLIISEQDLLRAEALKRLRQRMTEEGVDLDLDSQILDAENMDVTTFASATGTLPFMSPLRLVVVQGIDKLKAADERVQAVVEYCLNPNPTTVLTLTAQRVAKTTKLYKAVAKSGLVIDRKAPAKKDLPQHVALMFAQAGIQASSLDSTTLINLVGEDLASLNSAIGQLAAYKDVAGRRKSGDDSLVAISQLEITKLIGDISEVKAWELTDALANKDGSRTLDILDRLTRSEGEGVQFLVIFLAATKVRELLTARALIDRGEGTSAALIEQLQNHSTKGKGRSLQPWLADRILRQARQFSAEQLRESLRELAEVEYTMKTSPPQLGRLALVRCLLKLCKS
ncbi:MAG: DNA polymerase III subunit delta [Coriobacteriia bacterium]|nr:DNA polymerase III subunit delta [Coriobacteriia bacterium]